MIIDAQGKWFIEQRNVLGGEKPEALPVEFLVFVPVQDKRGGLSMQVTPLVLEKGELVPAMGKLSRR